MPILEPEALIRHLDQGGVIAFPTDTVTALATRPEQAERLYDLKQRDRRKPLILLGANANDLWPYVEADATARTLAAHHWPGALTLVLPSRHPVTATMNPGGGQSLGLRVPDSDLARQLLARTGPLATTSANRSGEPPLMTVAALLSGFPEVAILEGFEQQLMSGAPSTVVRCTPEGLQVLRQGAVIIPATLDPLRIS